MLAYLVIREGSKWTDVFRLVPGRTVTLGRAPTNQIVIKDERASRNHAEIFHSQDRWTLRDLDSRNGTVVGDTPVKGDRILSPGDVIRIAHSQMAFVHDLSAAFPESGGVTKSEADVKVDDETVVGRWSSDSSIFDSPDPTLITHRKGQTRFVGPAVEEDETAIPRVGRAATKLCRLAFELANQGDLHGVAKLALDGLFEGVPVDAGAILLAPERLTPEFTSSDLQLVESRSDREPSYQRVTTFLATTVLREGEAVLARNVDDDSNFGSRDSKGDLHATSTICAPIRQRSRVVGLIHLYSTDSDRIPDPDDLEFTLAVGDNVALALRNLNRQQELAENLSLTKNEILQLRKRLGAESQIVGSSEVMKKLQREIARAAPSRATVLVRGESGVGKELVARAVHFQSPRKKGPFVCLNCAALSETLLESELFGHEKGAFTGATDRKVGKFEAADQGTLMLDEIGEMSPSIQAKFLRVLEGHPFERVGGNKPIKTDVRVIAATNRDLEKAVKENKFRRDLFFRLHVLEINVPPLRRRGDDIMELAMYFLRQFSADTGRRFTGFTEDAEKQIRSYRWPGNVRELRNVVERATLLSKGPKIDTEDLTLTNLATAGDTGEIPAAANAYTPYSLAEMERRHIDNTLKATEWNKSRAASILGIERSTLDRKIRRYKIVRHEGSKG